MFWKLLLGLVVLALGTGNSDAGSLASNQLSCFFPFVFEGVAYRDCLTVGWFDPWCPTTWVYNGNWKKCEASDFNRAKSKNSGGGYKAVVPAQANCVPQFDVLKESQIQGSAGTTDLDAESIDDCKQSCLEEGDCSAFVFKSDKTFPCTIYTGDIGQWEEAEELPSDVYLLVSRCPDEEGSLAANCYINFDVTYQMFVPEGTRQSNLETFQACAEGCVLDDDCEAFGFDHYTDVADTSRCNFHTTSDLVDPVFLIEYNFYVPTEECTDPETTVQTTAEPVVTTKAEVEVTTASTNESESDCPVFETYEDTFTRGGEMQDGVLTAEECRAACVSQQDCVGVLFNRRSEALNNGVGDCSLFFDVADMEEKLDVQGYDLFILKSRCPEVTTKSTQDVTTEAYVCVPSFKYFPDTFTDGATAQEGDLSVDECQQRCVNTMGCLGIKYNRRAEDESLPPCSLHFDESDIKDTFALTGIDLYVLNVTCPSDGTMQPETTSAPCETRLNEMEDVIVPGGEVIAEASTYESCRDLCLNNDSCIAFGFDRWSYIADNFRCRLYPEGTSLDITIGLLFNTVYEILERCAPGTAGPTTTTTTAEQPSTASPTGSQATAGPCEYDLVFLFDRSGSIEDNNVPGQPPNWELMIEFAKSVVDAVDVGVGNTHIGAVLFGNRAYVQFQLDTYSTPDDVKDALDDLEYRKENTNTTGGLWAARTQVFSYAGDRPDVDNVIIMVTDGVPTKEVQSLPAEVQNVRDAGIQIVAIGIGEANETFLEGLVESSDYYYYIPDFSSLSSMAELVVQVACGNLPSQPTTEMAVVTTEIITTETTTPETTTTTTTQQTTVSVTTEAEQSTTVLTSPATPSGPCEYDLVFLFDRSGSIEDNNVPGQPPNWDLMIEFAKSVVDAVDVGIGSTHIGAVLFGNRAYVQFQLDTFSTPNAVKDALDDLEYRKENTNTTGGLWATRTQVFSLAGDRPDVENVIIMVTDGVPTIDKETLPAEVQNVRDAGIQIVAIGIGEANETFLQGLVESKDYYYYIPDFSSLSSMAELVVQVACGNLPTGATTTTSSPATTETKTTTTSTPPAGCEDGQFIYYNETEMPEDAGFNLPELSTLPECRDACLADLECTAFLFDSFGGIADTERCFLYTADDDLSRRVTLEQSELFILKEECREIPTTIESTSSKMTTPTTTSTGVERCYMVEMYNFNSDAGSLVGRMDQEECAKLCSETSGCISADWSKLRRSCYFHYDNKEPVTSDDCCIRFEKICSTSACEDSFRLFEGYSAGSGSRPDVDSLDDCQRECLSADDCKGIDWSEERSRCVIVTGERELKQSDDYDHYALLVCVDAAIEPTPQATTMPTTVTDPIVVSPYPTECIADIVFMVDSSGSINDAGDGNWDLVRRFLVALVDTLDVGPRANQVALVTYSTQAQFRFPLNRFSNKEDLQTVLTGLPYQGGKTNTPEGLRKVHEYALDKDEGNRPDVKDLVVVLTDGGTTKAYRGKLDEQIQDLKDTKAEVFGVGVTNKVDIGELTKIVSEPTSKYLHNITEFSDLINLLDILILGKCVDSTVAATATSTASTSAAVSTTASGPSDVATVRTTAVTVTEDDICKTDVVILLDRSGSICDPVGPGEPDGWDYIIEFSKKMIETFDIDSGIVRASTVTFGNKGDVYFYLDTYNNSKSGMLDALGDLACKKENTNTTGGLWVSRNDVLIKSRGKRDDASQVVIMVTDGKPTKDVELLDGEIRRYREDNIRLIAIGVGQADEPFLTSLVGTRENYHYLQSLSELNKIVTEVADQVCGKDIPNRPTNDPGRNTPGVTDAPATTTTERPGVARLDSVSFTKIAFGVARRDSFNQRGKVIFTETLASAPGYDGLASTFTVPEDGIYLISLNAGAEPRTPVEFKLQKEGLSAFQAILPGADPEIPVVVKRDSTSHTDTDLISRSAIVRFTKGTVLYMENGPDALYSDPEHQTAWSMFDLSAVMAQSDLVFFVASQSGGDDEGRVLFDQDILIPDGDAYNNNDDIFTCPEDGIYFFSFSTGVEAEKSVDVQLVVGARKFELRRDATNHNGIDTLSRSVLTNCMKDENVYVSLKGGEMYGDANTNVLAFMGFNYKPVGGDAVAFSAYRTTPLVASPNEITNVEFAEEEIQIKSEAFDGKTFTCPKTGKYYIYFSSGLEALQVMNFNLVKDGDTFVDVYRYSSAHNGLDTLGRGLVIELEEDQTLQLDVNPTTTLYGDTSLQITFFGFLIFSD